MVLLSILMDAYAPAPAPAPGQPAEKPFPWAPVAIGAGVLVGGGLLYQHFKKKPALGAAATKVAPKPTAAKPYTPSALPTPPKVTAPTVQTPPPGYGPSQPSPGYSSKPSSSSSSDDGLSSAQKSKLQSAVDAILKGGSGVAQAAESKDDSWLPSGLPGADVAEAVSDESSGLIIGSVRVPPRTVDDVRMRLHEAICHHPDYRGIGFCRVGGEVGLLVAGTQPMNLPRRVAGVPIVLGCC
jgi:hypothetical protein